MVQEVLGNGLRQTGVAYVMTSPASGPELETELIRVLQTRGPCHTWQLEGYGTRDEVVLALYRMRKAGLVTYGRDHQIWRLR